MTHWRQVEEETLRTFQEELPSVHFSDKSADSFHRYARNAEFTYRSCLKFPPEMFNQKSLIDFGAGTSENGVDSRNR